MTSDNTKEELLSELADARAQIAELEVTSKTSLSGGQFLCIVMLGPLFLAFDCLQDHIKTSRGCSSLRCHPFSIKYL